MRLLALATIIAAATPSTSDACICAKTRPCAELWNADAVFTGKVTSHQVLPRSHVEDVGGKKVTVIDDPGWTASVAIDQTFRGVVGAVETLRSRGCGVIDLVDGDTYFFYATRVGPDLEIGSCAGAAPLADAADDIAYVRSLATNPPGYVEGRLMGDDDYTGSLGNITVSVAKLKRSTQTNARGEFKLELPAGTHALDVTGSSTSLVSPTNATIVHASACALVDLDVQWAGIARGKLVRADGKPAIGVEVVARDPVRHASREARTGADGRYEIRGLDPTMTFVVSVSAPEDHGPSVDRPFASTYFPGVATEKAASRVTIPKTGIVDKLDFALPAPLAILQSGGVVRDRRGNPIVDLEVRIGSDRRARTDEQGRYSFRHLAGETVKIEACTDRRGKQVCTTTDKKVDGVSVIDLRL